MSMKTKMEQLVRSAQDTICAGLSKVDGSSFHEDLWERPNGGGGRTRVIEGTVFEKGGVNVSTVHGPLTPSMAATLNLEPPDADTRFFATGISLVIHPKNPFVPTVHANYRYFEVFKDDTPISWWFGGGADLTPYYLFENDAIHFHKTLKEASDTLDPVLYPKYKKECDDYFYLPHRKEHRGVGGMFILKVDDQNPETLFEWIGALADSFNPSYIPIVEKRRETPYTDAHKQWHKIRRGRYAEFNLLYDVGTKFGLHSNGRTESILMSLPPEVTWKYDHRPTPDSEEAKLLDVVTHPRNWA